MNETPFLLVLNVVFVAMVTSAPLSNEQSMSPAAASHAANAEDMIQVGKRTAEMVYYGNQQNEPRVPMKKSAPFELQPNAPIGELDQGASIVAHDEIPVEKDLNDRAEVTRGESDGDRLAEGLKVASELLEPKPDQDKDEKEVGNEEDDSSDDAMAVDLPEAGDESSEDLPEDGENPNADMAHDSDADDEDDVDNKAVDDFFADMRKEGSDDNDEENDDNDDDDNADEELESLSNEANDMIDVGGEGKDEEGYATGDKAVEDFFADMRKEGSDDNADNDNDDDDDVSNSIGNEVSNMKDYKVEPQNGAIDPNYYQTLYHILANTYRGDDYYNTMMPPYYVRRRRSPLRRASLASIRNRRHGRIRRIKRDLPSDWLAAYSGYDLPYASDDLEDSLLSEPEESYEGEEPVNEELSRYIYANLLNKLYGDELQADVEEEIPYEEILPYQLGPEIPEPYLEEKYAPEEILYDPEVYRENPYEDKYIPSYEYRKRSGAGYYGDSRRKRYFYPAYEEPETHWGAFVPEKRSGGGYDDALQRLQRLAFALSDNPRPYYESLLREYRKK